MKLFKYATILLAVAMSATFFSCDRENDIIGDPMANHNLGDKQDYWIDFTLSNPGSLSQAAQERFVELKDTTIYGEKRIKIIEHPMYVTEEYAIKNFDAVAAIPNSESDIVQKVMIPTAKIDKVRDFTVTMTLSKDSMNTVLATKTWNASECISDSDLQ